MRIDPIAQIAFVAFGTKWMLFLTNWVILLMLFQRGRDRDGRWDHSPAPPIPATHGSISKCMVVIRIGVVYAARSRQDQKQDRRP
jgi:hypothetical protein